MEIRDVVGKFFEKLAAKVLMAGPVANGTLDLGICKAFIGVEVKGSNSSNRFRISVEQLRLHLDRNLFLFPDMLEELIYCLFCYQNPRNPVGNGNGSKTTLSCCKDEAEIFAALARNTDTILVLDHRVIIAVIDLLGTVTGQFLCEREVEVVSLGKTYLQGFTEDGSKDRFISLKLDPEVWIARERRMHVTIHLGKCRHKLKPRIVEVLPKELMIRLDKAIRTPKTKRPARRTLVLKTQTYPHG